MSHEDKIWEQFEEFAQKNITFDLQENSYRYDTIKKKTWGDNNIKLLNQGNYAFHICRRDQELKGYFTDTLWELATSYLPQNHHMPPAIKKAVLLLILGCIVATSILGGPLAGLITAALSVAVYLITVLVFTLILYAIKKGNFEFNKYQEHKKYGCSLLSHNDRLIFFSKNQQFLDKKVKEQLPTKNLIDCIKAEINEDTIFLRGFS